ncbi:hypothetical protein [Frankia sp. AgB32]|uniref:hypothetical protein n=1 Tax=Frankia sp. AgB32 TaxID=631119 RepID=UPI00200CA4D1|nr:hypothetical protein [Frankia sp. AgB32]MCK9897061.1 hypothetical protein [Frankia sp. AgB32]
MRRRRRDHRSWEELSGEERRRGLAILAGAGIVAVVAVYLLVGSGPGTQAEAGASPPPTVDVNARLATWYSGTAQVRGQIVTAVGAVRSDIQAVNGMALQPACAQLGQLVDQIAPLGQPPAPAAAQAWSAGASAYGQAVTTCGNLFDGTAQQPAVLLARTTDALNSADGHWARLAAQIGAPAQIVPAR